EEDIGRGDEGRRAVDTVGAEVKIIDHLIEAEAAIEQRRRQRAAEERVRDEDRAKHRQAPAHQPPRGFEQEQQYRTADGEIDVRRLARALNELGLENPMIEAEQEAEAAKAPIVPRHRHLAVIARAEAYQRESQQHQEADMDRADDDA